jgi:hypothetical protein
LCLASARAAALPEATCVLRPGGRLIVGPPGGGDAQHRAVAVDTNR